MMTIQQAIKTELLDEPIDFQMRTVLTNTGAIVILIAIGNKSFRREHEILFGGIIKAGALNERNANPRNVIAVRLRYTLTEITFRYMHMRHVNAERTENIVNIMISTSVRAFTIDGNCCLIVLFAMSFAHVDFGQEDDIRRKLPRAEGVAVSLLSRYAF